MAPAKSAKQTDDTKLILYRLDIVESAVKELGLKLDKQDTIKRQDLVDFRDTIVTRMTEIKADLQKQIDDKADQSSLDDVKKLIGAVAALFSSVVAGLFLWVLTKGN